MTTKPKIILLAVMLSVCLGLFAQADSLDFPAPQYMLPMYDHYSQNNLNADAMGRGFTTTAVRGKVESAVNNPATLSGDKSFIYMEMVIKPPIEEINREGEMIYSAPVPFGIFGVNGKLYKGLLGAISYNMPKSVVYDDFTVETMQGADSVVRYPTYYLHQFTTTLAGSVGNLSLGFNMHHQLHEFQDITVYQTFDRVDRVFYVFRIQPGILYKWKDFNFGATFTPQTSTNMDIRYEDYNVTLPTKLNAGLTYGFGNNLLLAEADWEQFSNMDDSFKDRFTLKAGYEKTVRRITYRGGLMSMPGVYSGAYRLPVRETQNPEEVLWWNVIPRGGYIEKTDQLYLTAGFSYNFNGGKLAFGAMRDVLGNVDTTHLSMAMGFNLETLKGRKFLIFDK